MNETTEETEDWKEKLAIALRKSRRGESQASISSRSGVSNRTIGLIENQQLKRLPRAETVARLAIATGNNPREWLGYTGLEIKDYEIEMLQKSIRERISPDSLFYLIEQKYKQFEADAKKYFEERSEELKRDVIRQLENRLSEYLPAKKVVDYVDTRLSIFDSVQRDLMKKLSVSTQIE